VLILPFIKVQLEFAPDAEALTVFVLNIKVKAVKYSQLLNIQVAICIANHQNSNRWRSANECGKEISFPETSVIQQW
jgi:hypothetical protein